MPTLVCLAAATGVAAALAGRSELRVSPRPALLTHSFGAYALFLILLLVPISVYFYVFHGDWFLLYSVDVRRVPSAVALLGFVVQGLIGAGAFAVGSTLVRSQRDAVAAALAALLVVVSAAVVFVVQDRLAVVGSFAQYRGGFGLTPYGQGPLVQGTVGMSVILLAGLTYLLTRLYLGGRRSG